jgi:PPK2 family polyphosphate:nucleotide phosphotransferase
MTVCAGFSIHIGGEMENYRIKSGTKISLDDWDPDDTGRHGGSKDSAAIELSRLTKDLERLQELLYAEQKHKVLVVLQGMDTSGKDGVIRHVFEGVNPQGVKVASFKVPTPEELSHDYLWRIHNQTPGKGEIVIFNRSQYEDVLVVRVHELVGKEIWSRRFDQINQFERTLAEEGTTILKFFLHISLDEQKERLQARLDDPNKQWKFNIGDLNERKLWSKYMSAYEDVLQKTSTEWAPWYLIPANHKWYRDLVIGTTLVEKLKSLDMKYPLPVNDLSKIVIE